MTGIHRKSVGFFIGAGLLLASELFAGPISDPFVKNLTLVGVIHVEGSKTKGQSVAVLREKSTGRTRILHKGDSILDGDLEVSALGPQEITLVRGSKKFILRVETQSDTAPAYANHVETTEVELSNLENTTTQIPATVVEIPNNEESPNIPDKAPVERFEPELAPGSVCEGDECPGTS